MSRDDDYHLSDRTIDNLNRTEWSNGNYERPACISDIYMGAYSRKDHREGLQKTIADEIMIAAKEIMDE